jgi:hypothetical protein
LNTLAASHFRKVLGDSNAHQLLPSTEGGHPRPDYAEELQGVLFAGGVTRDQLMALIKAGALVTTVPIEDGLDFGQVQARFGQDAAPLFSIDEDETELSFIDRDDPLPASGSLVLLAPP